MGRSEVTRVNPGGREQKKETVTSRITIRKFRIFGRYARAKPVDVAIDERSGGRGGFKRRQFSECQEPDTATRATQLPPEHPVNVAAL